MNKPFRLTIHLTALFACLFSFGVFGKTEVTDLRCEYLINPIGIDVATPRLSWKIVSDAMNFVQTAYEIRMANTEKALKTGRDFYWQSGKLASGESVNVNYAGPKLSPGQRVYWQVRVWTGPTENSGWSAPSFWEAGLLDYGNWKAHWITSNDGKTSEKTRPCSYFRKEFQTSRKIESARLYASALGLYQLFINGKKVGDQLFSPGWTSYNKRVQYQTYDVTKLLASRNSVGAIVGDGWYRGTIGKNQNYYGDQTALILQLEIKYTDGSNEIVSTDDSWKTSGGAILSSDIYQGEVYDARLEQDGWNMAGFNDKLWTRTTVLNHPISILVSQQGVPVKAIQEIKPVNFIKTPKGETVFDMGQNMVGWIRLKVSGSPGSKVVMNFAEVLDRDGNFYTNNLRSAKATDVYFLKGKGTEIFEPHFTFHGFRYVKVEGFPGNPDLNTITGIVIHSDMEPTGHFSCSDSLVNRLQENIVWSQKGNSLDIPSDCPQRDERLGWTGDAQIFCPTASFNFDVAPFFTKWLGDLKADQSANGAVPDVIPDVTTGGGSAGWGDAAVVVPWTLYLNYNDKRILEQQYPSMKAWVEYMRNRAGDDCIWSGDTQFGDWQELIPSYVNDPKFVTNKDFIATAFYFHTSGILAKVAGILGKNEEAEEYSNLAEKIKGMFLLNFVTPAGKLNSNTQTAYVVALAFDLLPDNLARKASVYLASYIESVGHLTTGFIGTPLLCSTLSKMGRADLAFKLLLRKDYPSWLYPVTLGATTIWERWDGIRPDGTFQNESMNSFNHYAYGSIGQWLYQYVAGLNPDELQPGYKHIILKPHPGTGLSWAKAEYRSMYGRIVSGWRIENGKMFIQAQIPANTTASLFIPVRGPAEVMVNGQNRHLETGSGIELGSGSYQVEIDYPAN